MRFSRLLDQLPAPLVKILQRSDHLVPVAGLLVRSMFWGTALYWALGTDRIANLQINAVSFVLATGWAYVDGVFSRRIWRYAFEEGVILHFLSENGDVSAPEEEKEPSGLTLKQAAVIYFGGLALLIGSMVFVGLLT